MSRPGTDVYITDDALPGGPNLDTGQAFFAGVAERGPVGVSSELGSLKQYATAYGDRAGGSLLYDAVSAFFAEGGSRLHVSRISGANGDTATIAFGSATVNAASPGAWGNDLTVTANDPATLLALMQAQAPAQQAAGDPVVVVVELDGVEVERSSTLADVDALVAWSQSSDYVDVVKGADNTLPASGTTADLAGGVDDNTVDADSIAAALACFDYALGPGQVAAPGLTSPEAHEALLDHCTAKMRCALLDEPDSADALAIGAEVTSLYGYEGVRFAAALAPWIEYPASVSPATVIVPYSGVQAGIIARLDALGNPNQTAAGAAGVSRMALGLSYDFTDDEREALNEVGVTMAKLVYGDVRTYGGRTAAGPDDVNWLWFGNSRVVMAIAHEADAIGENYVLRQIDGRHKVFAALESDLRGMLLRYYNLGALYGETPEEAFSVDTSTGINTPETIAAGEMHAAIYVKCSPSAEWVRIDIVKVPIERSLPVAA